MREIELFEIEIFIYKVWTSFGQLAFGNTECSRKKCGLSKHVPNFREQKNVLHKA